MTDAEIKTKALLHIGKDYHPWNGLVEKGFLRGYVAGYNDVMADWHDLRKNPKDLPPSDVYVLIAWSNTYNDKGLETNNDNLHLAIAGQFYFEPDEDESYEPGFYWHDEEDNEYDGEVVMWHELPQLPGWNK